MAGEYLVVVDNLVAHMDPAKARELLAMNDDDFGAALAQMCSAMSIAPAEGDGE